MNDTDKKLILEKYERIESLYRQYQYAKETADLYLKKYFAELQTLPMFKAPHEFIEKGLKNENK